MLYCLHYSNNFCTKQDCLKWLMSPRTLIIKRKICYFQIFPQDFRHAIGRCKIYHKKHLHNRWQNWTYDIVGFILFLYFIFYFFNVGTFQGCFFYLIHFSWFHTWYIIQGIWFSFPSPWNPHKPLGLLLPFRESMGLSISPPSSPILM